MPGRSLGPVVVLPGPASRFVAVRLGAGTRTTRPLPLPSTAWQGPLPSSQVVESMVRRATIEGDALRSKEEGFARARTEIAAPPAANVTGCPLAFRSGATGVRPGP